MEVAEELILSGLPNPARNRKPGADLIEQNPGLIDRVIRLRTRTCRGNIAIPLCAKAILGGLLLPEAVAMEEESRLCAELCRTPNSRHMVENFVVNRSKARKRPQGAKPGPVEQLAIIGTPDTIVAQMYLPLLDSSKVNKLVLIVCPEYRPQCEAVNQAREATNLTFADEVTAVIERYLADHVTSGKLTTEAALSARQKVIVTPFASELIADCDVVLEALPDDLSIKLGAYALVDSAKAKSDKPYRIFSITRSLPFQELASAPGIPRTLLGCSCSNRARSRRWLGLLKLAMTQRPPP